MRKNIGNQKCALFVDNNGDSWYESIFEEIENCKIIT